MKAKRKLLVYPDFGSPAIWDDHHYAVGQALPISDELRSELMRWQLQWDDWVTDCSSRATAEGWRQWDAWGERLVVRIQEELGPDYDVQGDFYQAGRAGDPSEADLRALKDELGTRDGRQS